MQDLIDRLEKAIGPDRDLDAAIYERVVGLQMYESVHKHADGSLCLRYYPGPPGPEYHPLPRYTASIDDALKLVAEGFAWTLATQGRRAPFKYWCSVAFPDEEAGSDQGVGPTAALAGCIAALKARAALVAKET